MPLAKSHLEMHEKIKADVERSWSANFENVRRYKEFQAFVFKTNLDQNNKSSLASLDRPLVECNMVNAPISRLCGEFYKQEPSVYIRPNMDSDIDMLMARDLEDHIRYVLYEAQKSNTQYITYRNQLSGGFGVFRIDIDYAGPRSFKQCPKLRHVMDPTTVVFDPLAREVNKSDARFVWEKIPMTKEDFKERHPNVDLSKLRHSNAKFDWTYKTDTGDVVNVIEYYTYKKSFETIVEMANGRVLTKNEYEFEKKQSELNNDIIQFPVIKQKRKTTISKVCRYTLIGTEVIAYDETEFSQLPFIYVDGDSALLKDIDTDNCNATQFSKPYIYHAKGLQQLVNLAAQAIGTDMQTMVMHKFMIMKEALPDEADFRDAYTNVQKANILVYRGFLKGAGGGSVQLPPPMPVPRVALPAEVANMFAGAMPMLQNILGSYDASLGINDNHLSGVSIVEGATQSNAAAMPYIVNYMQALTQAAIVIVNLIPKLYKTARTIPVRTKEGEHAYIQLGAERPLFKYNDGDLDVSIEAGVSFAIAKNQALKQMTALMQAVPEFGQFMQGNCMDVILDNMEFRGVEVVKERYKKAKEEAEQNPQQSPEEMEMQIEKEKADTEAQKVANQAIETKLDAISKIGTVLVSKTKADNERLNTLIKMGTSMTELKAAEVRAEAEEDRARTDLEIALDEMQLKREDQHHKHAVDIIDIFKS